VYKRQVRGYYTCLLAVIVRFGVAAETISITSPLADGTIESHTISVGGSGSGVALTA